jgi:hypothetical protein
MANKKSKHPVSKAARTAAPRKRGAPVTVRVSTSVEMDLLAQAERFARDHQTTVSALLAEGLRKVIGYSKAPVLPPGDLVTQPAETATPGWDQMLAWMEDHQVALTQIRDAIGEVAASLPTDAPPGADRPSPGKRIPPL